MTQPLNKKFPPALQATPLTMGGERINRPWLDQLAKFSQAQFASLTNTQRLSRNAGSFPDGSMLYESDTGVLYLANGGNWQYVAGIRFVVAQSVVTLGLGVHDSGYQVYVVDLAHALVWDGTGFHFADGGSGYIVPFVSAPNPTTGWQLCDGTVNVPTLNGDGTMNFVTVPVTPGSYFRQ